MADLDTVKKKGGAIVHAIWLVLGIILGAIGHEVVVPDSTGGAIVEIKEDIDIVRGTNDEEIIVDEPADEPAPGEVEDDGVDNSGS